MAAGAWPGWAAATPVAANFAPGPAGTAQTVVISGLRAETAYRVALSSYDEADNAAVPSNVAVAGIVDGARHVSVHACTVTSSSRVTAPAASAGTETGT